MGHTDSFRRISGANRRAVDLGSRTSRTLSSHLHTTAVAQLAGEGRVYHSGLYARAGVALHRELDRSKIVSVVVDDSGDSVIDLDGSLHGVSFRAGKGARHVAKPSAAAASACSGVAARFRGFASTGSDTKRRDDV